MPVARFGLPDGRVARFEVPDGTTPEQAQSLIEDHIRENGLSSLDPAKQALPEGVKPSTAGAGRGDINPRPASSIRQRGGVGLEMARPYVADAPTGPEPTTSDLALAVPKMAAEAVVDTAKGFGRARDAFTPQSLRATGQRWFDEKPSVLETPPKAEDVSPAQMTALDLAAGMSVRPGAENQVRAQLRARGIPIPGESLGSASAPQTGLMDKATAAAGRAGGAVQSTGDIMLSAAQMVPQTLKLGSDIAQIVTLGMTKPLSDALQSWSDELGNQQSYAQRRATDKFQILLKDPNVSQAQITSFLLQNPEFTVNTALPSFGSMLVGVGGAKVGQQVLTRMATRRGAIGAELKAAGDRGAELGASIANAAMNAGDTFDQTSGDYWKKLLSAGTAFAGTAAVGKLTEGGVASQLVKEGKRLSANPVANTAAKAGLGSLREYGQEYGEQWSQDVGQQQAENGKIDPGFIAKDAAAAGVQGALMGLMGAGNQGRGIARDSIMAAADLAAQRAGLTPRAAAALRESIVNMEPDQAVGFIERALTGFERRGLATKPGSVTAFKDEVAKRIAQTAQSLQAQTKPGQLSERTTETAPLAPSSDAAGQERTPADDFTGLATPPRAATTPVVVGTHDDGTPVIQTGPYLRTPDGQFTEAPANPIEVTQEAANGADTAGTGGQRPADAGRGDGTQQLPDQQPGNLPAGPGAAAGQGGVGNGAAGLAAAGSDALTDLRQGIGQIGEILGAKPALDPKQGDRVLLDGKPWSVAKVGKASVTLQGEDGKKRPIQRGSEAWNQMTAAPAAPAQAAPESAAGNQGATNGSQEGQQGQGRRQAGLLTEGAGETPTAGARELRAGPATEESDGVKPVIKWQRLPARGDVPGSLRHRFTTKEGMDGQVLVSPPGWRKGVKSFVVSFDRTGGPLQEDGRTKFYPTVDIGKYRTEESAILAAEKVIAEHAKEADAPKQNAGTTAANPVVESFNPRDRDSGEGAVASTQDGGGPAPNAEAPVQSASGERPAEPAASAPAPKRTEARGKANHPQTVEATHKDPGEAAEPVTPAVVRDAIKTGVDDTGRKPSAMKAELLREIDQAVKDAPDYGDFEATVKTMGLKDATAVFTDAKGTMGETAAPQGYSRPKRTFRVEGDGVFTVNNTVRQLLIFREKVERSPGFRDRQTQGGLTERATDTLDRRSTDAAIANMLDEGDFEAAMDFAAAKGVDMANVKLTKVLRDRLEKWQKDQESAKRMAEYQAAQEAGKPAPGSLAAMMAEKGAADAQPDAEQQTEDTPEVAAIASQTFDQWVRAKYDDNEYKDKYLEEFGGDEKRAILGAALGTIDNERKSSDLLKAAKAKYHGELLDLPRETRISLDVWDALDNMTKVEAQRHFYDLDSRITRRDQDATKARVEAERAKKAPYEAAFAEVDAEIRRLDALPGPETQKQKDLSARRDRLREAIYQIGQGKEPDGRLLRKAKADLMAGLGDIASILSKNTRANITPEQEQALLPALTRVFDAAFRMGHVKFKQAARFVLDTIRQMLGDSVASQITLDHLQGAYIGMAGKYREQGADKPTTVAAVESLDALNESGAAEAAQPAPAAPQATAPTNKTAERPAELIELRKREAVLTRLLECLG